MGEEALLELAKQFIQTPEGQKLIVDQIDVDQIEKKLLKLEAGDNSDLTREERKQRRIERRENRRERRIERRDKRGEEKIQSKAKIKSNIPVLKPFKIKGKLYDTQTGNPLEGIEIKTIEALIPKKTKSDKNGIFEVIVNVAVLPSLITIKAESEDGMVIEREIKVRNNDISILRPKLLYTLSDYIPTTQEITNLDNTIKSDLNTIGLTNINEASKQSSSDIKNTMDQVGNTLNSIYLDKVELLIVTKRKSIMKVVNVIKTRLVPLAIGLLISFGISKLTQKSQKVCPSSEELKDVIRRRNSIIKQLNQIYLTVVVNSTLAAAFLALSKVIKGVRSTVDNIPLPLAIGGPSPVGLVFTQTYATVAKLQNVKDTLKELEETNKDLNKQILIALVFLVISLTIILLLLNGLDKLIEECSVENEIPFEEISEELLDLTQEAEEEGEVISSNINGFILSVETSKNSVGNLKRRQAIAKNSQGVILLRGEPSFSSSDQILIDELKFYIQQNDLKAN